MYDGSSTSARLTGMMCLAAYDELPQAEYTAIAMEYGTQPMLEVMHALRSNTGCTSTRRRRLNWRGRSSS